MKNEEKKGKKSTTKCSDPELWQACAGLTVSVPTVGSSVFYFAQGHAENANCSADIAASLGLPPLVRCRVAAVDLGAHADSDEVFARIGLVPLPPGADCNDGECEPPTPTPPPAASASGVSSSSAVAAPASFAKVLTQSDANNGGGFSVPRHCADTIFPPLNYKADPPVQDLLARDVHGEVWKFRHIYRGTPRRHLLTSGWSVFVNRKHLVAKDSILFLRTGQGEICVCVRRTRRGVDVANYGGIYARMAGGAGQEEGRARAEGFAEAVTAAASGKAFEVVYYPREGAAEFCVKASAVRAAMAEQWSVGMRVKMNMEDEAASRVKSCLGTVASVQAYDPARWPNSPWRLLQVAWDDEPDKLRNPQRVSPWVTEVTEGVSNFPSFPFPSFSSPTKKLRLSQYPDFTLGGQFCMSPSILGNTLGPGSPLGYLPNSNPAGIQGARHFLSEFPLPGFHFNNQLQSGAISPLNIPQLKNHPGTSNGIVPSQTHGNGSSPSLPEVEDSSLNSEKSEGVKKDLLLFGFHLERQQSSSSSSSNLVSPETKSPAHEKAEMEKSASDASGVTLQATEFGSVCRVFQDFKDLDWNLDLSPLGSYEELYITLSNTLKIERSKLTHVIYHDAAGAFKQIGTKPYSEFAKSAKRLTVSAPPGSHSHN